MSFDLVTRSAGITGVIAVVGIKVRFNALMALRAAQENPDAAVEPNAFKVFQQRF